MPKKELMKWDKLQGRWRKRYKGIRYTITPEALGLPPGKWTKEGSLDAANLWWETKLTELGGLTQIEPERQEALDEVDRKITWASQNKPKEVPALKVKRAKLEKVKDTDELPSVEDEIKNKLAAAKLLGIEVPADADPAALATFFGTADKWGVRFAESNLTAKDKTVRANLDRFLKLLRNKQKPQTHGELRDYLESLVEECILPVDATKINEAVVDAHYDHLAGKQWANAGRNKRLGFFRRFVKWLGIQNILQHLPKNLESTDHLFKVTAKKVKRFSGVKEVIEALPVKHRLWAMLGLNCSMTQADLGELTWDMIDMKEGTLTRKRVKTEDVEDVPTVTYWLFPETKKLLAELPKKGDLVFYTEAGTPMYESGFENEVEWKKDMFSTRWGDLDPKPKITLGKFRSIGADTMGKDAIHRGYRDYFLGHAGGLTDKHYANEHDNPFFQALRFLRGEIFGPEQ